MLNGPMTFSSQTERGTRCFVGRKQRASSLALNAACLDLDGLKAANGGVHLKPPRLHHTLARYYQHSSNPAMGRLNSTGIDEALTSKMRKLLSVRLTLAG